MIGQRAIVARPETASDRRQRKTYLLHRRHSAFVDGVRAPLVRQRVDLVHLPDRQRTLRRVLNEPPLPVPLRDGLAGKVGVARLDVERVDVLALVAAHLFERRTDEHISALYRLCLPLGERVGHIAGAAHVAYAPERHSPVEQRAYVLDRSLAHAVDEQIRARRRQNGRQHAVAPIVVVREAAQRRLYAADDDGDVRKESFERAAIDVDAAVGTFADVAALAVHVAFAPDLGDGVVVDHAVDDAAGDQKAQPRRAEAHIVPVALRLRQHRDRIAERDEQPRDDRVPERRVIAIRLADHIYEIGCAVKLFRRDRKEQFSPLDTVRAPTSGAPFFTGST